MDVSTGYLMRCIFKMRDVIFYEIATGVQVCGRTVPKDAKVDLSRAKTI